MIDYEAKHRWSILTRIRGSVLPRLIPRILAAGAVGAMAAYCFDAYGTKIPAIAHTLIGVALGLLLVFRTNASYDRYWEGRRLLGSIVNRVRDLMRQVVAYAPDEVSEAAEVRKLLNAFWALSCQYLRGERNLVVVPFLTDEERARLEPHSVRPAVVLTWLTEGLRALADRGVLTEHRLASMDQNVTSLLDSLGGCERIARTPVPFAYAQHIKIAVSLFCFTAPFAMVEAMHWKTPVAAAVLAFALFGIDEIGVEIEGPFGYDANDLPLEPIGEGLIKATADILGASAASVPAGERAAS